MEDCITATVRDLRIDLEDRVRFRVRPDCVALFRGNPEIRLADSPGEDGLFEATARFLWLIRALGEAWPPGMELPIATTIELILSP